VITIANYVGGKLLAPAAGRYLDDIEPATGRPYALVPESDAVDDAVDLEAAVAATRGAFPRWAKQTVAERSQLLLRIAEGIEGEAEALARAESIDTGPSRSASRARSISRAPRRISAFSPMPSLSSRANRTAWGRPRSTTPCAIRSAPIT